jgi:hypothetical protein
MNINNYNTKWWPIGTTEKNVGLIDDLAFSTQVTLYNVVDLTGDKSANIAKLVTKYSFHKTTAISSLMGIDPVTKIMYNY